jgi:hypothetical protein
MMKKTIDDRPSIQLYIHSLNGLLLLLLKLLKEHTASSRYTTGQDQN